MEDDKKRKQGFEYPSLPSPNEAANAVGGAARKGANFLGQTAKRLYDTTQAPSRALMSGGASVARGFMGRPEPGTPQPPAAKEDMQAPVPFNPPQIFRNEANRLRDAAQPLAVPPEAVNEKPTDVPGLAGRGTVPGGSGAARPRLNQDMPEGSITVLKGTDVYYTDPDSPEVLLPAIPGASLEQLREAKAFQDGGYEAAANDQVQTTKANAAGLQSQASYLNSITASQQSGTDAEGNRVSTTRDANGNQVVDTGFIPDALPQKPVVTETGDITNPQTLSLQGGQVTNLSQGVMNTEVYDRAKRINQADPTIGIEAAMRQAEEALSEENGKPYRFIGN